MKAKQDILFKILFFIIMTSMFFLWKPWGKTVLWGWLGISFLREAIIFWRKAKMIYMSIYSAVWAITFLVFFVQSLVIPNASWSWIILLTLIVTFIMRGFERRKNPDKVKKYESAWKRVSFFELLSLKYIADLEDKEKPENKER